MLEGDTERELTVQARNQALNGSTCEASPAKYLSTRYATRRRFWLLTL